MSKLTVAQRVLLHLSLFSRYREEFECPEDMTQKGISGVLGLSRSHVALELKKLVEAKEVEVRLAHVRGARSRRKVYLLTFQAERKAASMRDKARGAEARWIGPEGELLEGQGLELLRTARRLHRPLTQVYLGLLGGTVVDLREPSITPAAAPALDIAGRARELEELRSWQEGGPTFLLLTGIAGIGKTTLARALYHDTSKGAWIRLYPFHSASSLLTAIAHGLASIGRSRLLSYIKSHPPDYHEAGVLLCREASGVQLFLDNVAASPQAAQVLRLLLDSPPPDCRVLMTARRRPEFIKGADVLDGKVQEMTLQGLDRDGTGELLDRLGARAADIEDMQRMTGGHPLLLKMSATAQRFPRSPDVAAFFQDEILDDLTDAEEEVLIKASVFRGLASRAALGDPGRRIIRSLLRAGLLTESEAGYEVHEIIAPLMREHGGEDLRRAHELAAEFCHETGDWFEAIYHLQASGQTKVALKRAEERLEEILGAGRAEELLGLLGEARHLPSPTLDYLEARTLDYLGRWSKALLVLERGFPMAGPGRKIQMLLLRGRIHSKRGQVDEALEAFQGAAALARARGREVDLGRALYGLGIVERKMGRLGETRKLLHEALKHFDSGEGVTDTGRVRMEMGIAELQADNPEAAARWFHDAAPLLASSLVDSAYLYNNLGIAYSKLSQQEEALKAFEESLELAEKAGMVRAEGYALSNAADLYIERGQVETALDYCDRSLQIFEDLEDPVMISACYANRAKAERSRGNLEKAENLYQDSLRALEGTRAPYSLAARWLEFSDLYQELGERSKSEKLRSKALAVMRESGSTQPGS